MSITRLLELEREMARLHAEQVKSLVAVATSERVVDEYLVSGLDEADKAIRIEDASREEIAAALRWAPSTTQTRIDDARLLVGPLSEVLAALDNGEISPQHARVITEAAHRLPGQRAADPGEAEAFAVACADLVRRVLPVARRGTLSSTRQAARRAVLAIDAEGERQRRARARCTRDVWVFDELDGISTLMARLSTENAHAVMNHITAVAKATRDTANDQPEQAVNAHDGARSWTIGEHRAHALMAAVLGGDCLAAPVLTAHLDLVIDLPTLIALRDEDADGVVDVLGSGSAHAAALHDLLADPDVAITLQRLVADPLTGHLVDYGRRTYEIPDRLRDFIVARDRTCRFPGCRRRASRCQIDHAEAWEDGGVTAPANLGALCTRHHQLKTHGGWQISRSASDGSCTWTSPEGRTYEHAPPPVSSGFDPDVGPVYGPPPF